MSKLFNNTNKAQYLAERNLNLAGWEPVPPYDSDRIPRISDTVGAGIALTKMGTSIPTPFARVFLFKTAFEMVNASTAGADDTSAYGKLVSECLDFIEFIYLNGDNITVKPWNVNNELNALQNSPNPGHQRLAAGLENFARNLGVADIYLIYFDNVLIGGTSPFTLVYTSPNWQRIKPISNARGLGGNTLFPDYSQPHILPVPLHNRDEGFQLMLTKYYIAFRNVNKMANTAFFKYIYRNQEMFSPRMMTEFRRLAGINAYSISDFIKEYGCVRDNVAEIDILGEGGDQVLFLPKLRENGGKEVGTDINIADDYKIAPTAQRFGNGRLLPLVLTESGITGAIYVAGNPLPRGIGNEIIANAVGISPESRTLPGGHNISYPYLTISDFLQEKLIKVPYKMDTGNFYTFGVDSGNEYYDYLLPLTKRFFEYFSPSDLENDNVRNLSVELHEISNNEVEVKLNIPVQFTSRPCIELKKTYKSTDIVSLGSDPNLFTLGVFPSYRITTNNVPNRYAIMRYDGQRDYLGLNYYVLNDNEHQVAQICTIDSGIRDTFGCRYDTLNANFDIIEINWNGANAVALPRFKPITVAAQGNNTVVGIDFGTTNTYICLSTNSGAEPQSLEITKNDMQVLLFNKVNLENGNYGRKYQDSMYNMPFFMQALDREFVPLLLGRQSDVAYPFRTVTCENHNFEDKVTPMLFADISVGFNFMKEMNELRAEKYNTSIKWDIETATNNLPVIEKRMKAYCEQTAWMIKNKLMLMNNPCVHLTLYLTFPHTMSRGTRNRIETFWQNAFDLHLGNGHTQIKRVTESIAPYYAMIAHGANFTENALNIDIGGGTTDMLFADVRNRRFYYTSSLFAGNDIWGDGKQLVQMTKKDNGFVKDFENKLQTELSVTPERKDGYYRYRDIVDNSSDLMTYVFKYDNEFHYISYIQSSKNKLMPILCVHLGALLYHVAQVLKKTGIEAPTTIMFSGMGAQYIRMISNREDDIKDVVKELLSKFLGTSLPNAFTVKFQTNAKEVTAQGAMLVGHSSLAAIQEYKDSPLCVYGVETEQPSIRYSEAPKYKESVLKEFDQFLNAFVNDEDIRKFFKKDFGIEMTEQLANILREEANISFDLMAQEKKDNDEVEETMFFWPLKNGLYKASKNE